MSAPSLIVSGCVSLSYLFRLVAGMVSLWSLAVVAFERWLVVCKPLGNFVFKPNHAIACCAMTWVFALCAAVPPLVGWSRSVYKDQTHNSVYMVLIVGRVIQLFLRKCTNGASEFFFIPYS